MSRNKEKVKNTKAAALAVLDNYAGDLSNLSPLTLRSSSRRPLEVLVPTVPKVPALQRHEVLKAVLPQVKTHATHFLNQVSKWLCGPTFDTLSLKQRDLVWKSIKVHQRRFDDYMLEELALIMDSSFSTTNNEIRNFDSNLLRLFTQNIFHYESYLCMTPAEQKLLRDFLTETMGTWTQWKGPTMAELKKVFANLRSTLPESFAPPTKERSVDAQLKNLITRTDLKRFKCLMKRHALEFFQRPDDLLCRPALQILEGQVQVEYKAKIIADKGKEPCSLDQAAYLVYLLPFKVLTPYAQCCIRRFRELMIEKQWIYLRMLEADASLAESAFSVAFFGLEEPKLAFLVNQSMNTKMLGVVERQSLHAFPMDFPNRFKRMLELRKTFPKKGYLEALFLKDPRKALARHDPTKKTIEPESVPPHFTLAFKRTASEFDSGVAQNAIGKEIAQFLADELKNQLAAAVSTPSEEQTKDAVPQEYMDVLDVMLVDDASSDDQEQTVEKETDKREGQTARSSRQDPQEGIESQKGKEQNSSVGNRSIEKVVFIDRKHKPRMSCGGDLYSKVNYFFDLKGRATWCKFKILDSSHLEKDELLLSFAKSLPNNIQRLFIMKFHIEGNDSVFYSRQCADVIHFINRKNFSLKLDMHKENLEIAVELHSTINEELPMPNMMNNLLMDLLGKMLHEQKGHMNLSLFHKSFQLYAGDTEIVYPLCHHANLLHILGCANSISAEPIVSIDLSNNRIENINLGQNRLCGHFEKLTTLDLRNNKLNLSAVNGFSALPVKKIFLDGNPLCSFYEREQDYISDVMKIWPDLEYLDGIKVSFPGLPAAKKHFVCAQSAKPFADQFLTHYFSIFDSGRRDLLAGVYHSKATVTLTSQYLIGQSTSSEAFLAFYIKQSRNIKTISDFSKLNDLVLDGSSSILDFYSSCPQSRHDTSAFNVDVLGFTDKRVHVSVSGIFWEEVSSKMQPRYFRRVMFLVNFHDTFLIVNELVHINNCTTEQAAVPENNDWEGQPELELYLTTNPRLTFLTDEKKLVMMKKLSDLTGMNILWSKSCLEDMRWDLRNALIYFQGFYEQSMIPSEAFS